MLPRRRPRVDGDDFQDLNVTPYMNLMAVLIPFLLSVIVFTRLAVLEIYLPPSSEDQQEEAQETNDEPLFLLTISIGDEGILVTNRDALLGFIPAGPEGHQTGELNKIIKTLKKQFPQEDSAVILSKGNTSYGTLISVMDAVQTTEKLPRKALFPNVSLGEIQ